MLSNLINGQFITLFIALLTILICYYKWFCYNYWKSQNVPNLQKYISKTKIHDGIQLRYLYNIMRQKNWKVGGFYQRLSPVYIISDLNYIKNIMTCDFNYFPHRGLYYNEKSDPLSAHIFNTSGPKWRNMRNKLNQIFTSNKLKAMFPILLESEKNLCKNIFLESTKSKEIDIKKIFDCFIGDVIESCVFGLDCKIYQKDSIFRQFGRKIFNRSRLRRFKGLIIENFPKLANLLDITLIPPDASDFFLKIVKDTVNYRKKTQLTRQDFLQVLIDLREKFKLTIEEIAAHCFISFIAGMSTSPTAMTFTLYELAKNQEIQEKVRLEILEISGKYHNELTYDSLQEMKYLDQVFQEGLRMYPPAAYLNRKCEQDYKVSETDLVIRKGTTVTIPVLGIHYDEKYYLNSEKFDPERFNEEKRKLRNNFTFIPFGEGPRICIGMRFGLMQSKLGLVSLLKHYRFTVSRKTKEPLKMKSNSLVLSAEGEIWLNMCKI